MSTKSLLFGAGLMLLGVLIGFGMGMSSQCASKKNPPCYENAKCYKQKVKKGEKCKKPSFKQRLAMELNLSEEQIKEVDSIFFANRELRKAKKAEHKIALKEVREKTNSEIKAILDAEQQAKFEEMIKNCPKNRKACNKTNPENCNLQQGNNN